MDNRTPSSIPALLVYIVAQEDKSWREDLDKQLATWRRWELLKTCSPEDTPAGSDVELEIAPQIAKAAIVVLLWYSCSVQTI